MLRFRLVLSVLYLIVVDCMGHSFQYTECALIHAIFCTLARFPMCLMVVLLFASFFLSFSLFPLAILHLTHSPSLSVTLSRPRMFFLQTFNSHQSYKTHFAHSRHSVKYPINLIQRYILILIRFFFVLIGAWFVFLLCWSLFEMHFTLMTDSKVRCNKKKLNILKFKQKNIISNYIKY